jgi:hypothetical protein
LKVFSDLRALGFLAVKPMAAFPLSIRGFRETRPELVEAVSG